MPDFCLQQIFMEKPDDSEHMGYAIEDDSPWEVLPGQLQPRVGWGAHTETSTQVDHRPANPTAVHPFIPLPSPLGL